ncbi:hypothetical protein AVEN_232626-1 [Araneus ventricosus]|uniref:Retrovirus-related Pol polyprotein from transposon 297 n=1 Tax=Araneus ventricosus TaxID=182803 RepID=A0A4Y2RNS2_ARAVE|nr:hypothetical protein AVEN_232626-1 [Araneus ventricosus]
MFPNYSNHIHTNENTFSNSNDTFDINENEENTTEQESFIGNVFKKVLIPANSQHYINIKLDDIDIAELVVCDLIEHKIHLTDQIPTRQKPYRVPYNLKPEMMKQIIVLLEPGIIQASKSPFCASALLVKKADKSYRLVAYLRKLNKKTIPDTFPLPNLTEMIDNLSGAKHFSTLDLS